jgi:DNA-binding CsgD family transcriptional regulator
MFVFCERATGAARFHAESGTDLNCTVERMASLLAIQCLVRGSDPGDFAILVPAEKILTNRLVSRAKELLKEGREARSSSLSPRQREILQSVVCNRANKEIAWKLHISVRTVKFHISALLSKFHVTNRAELARKAMGFLPPTALDSEISELEPPSKLSVDVEPRPVALRSALHVASKARNERFRERTLTA